MCHAVYWELEFKSVLLQAMSWQVHKQWSLILRSFYFHFPKWFTNEWNVMYVLDNVINNTSTFYTQWWLVIMQLYTKSYDFDSNVHVSLYSNLQSDFSSTLIRMSKIYMCISFPLYESIFMHLFASRSFYEPSSLSTI